MNAESEARGQSQTTSHPELGAQGGDIGGGGSAERLEVRLEQLQRIADTALGYMSLEQVLSELLGRIREALRADTAAILLLDEERNVLVARAARGLEEEVRQGVQVPVARGFAGRVAAEARPIIIEDLSRAEVVNPLLREKGISSMLGVPLHVEGRVIGVMHVGTLERRVFDQEDVRLLQLAADRAALAVDNARLLEQRAATEMMQRTLLPEALPTVPGLRFSAKYLPAGSDIKIGGDWYDAFQLADGRLVFVIGDVVGRGVVAASVMAEIRTALRAYLMEGHRPASVMSLLNDLLVALGRNRSATAAIVELDLEPGELEVVSAGHLPPLLVSPGGEPAFLSPDQGLPLGFRAGEKYPARRHGFPVGSALLLYTDGLVERRRETIQQGLDRLSTVAARATTVERVRFADTVYRALVDEREQEDDVALLAIESLPLGATIALTFDASAAVLPELRRTVRRWLISQGAGEEAIFDLCTAASEAASNAIEHAYGASEATFTVLCERTDAGLRVTVQDSGRWRRRRPYDRGRGLAIMGAMVDSMDIERRQSGTSVTLTKTLAQDSA